MKFKSIDELLNYTENIKGKTFREIDSEDLLEGYTNLKRKKGLLGEVVETGFYKYPLNNNPQADFDEIGVELKVTGYKRSKKGKISAKERVSLSMIDYNSIINEEFDFSKLLFKNKKILLIWYEYEKGKDVGDFLITDYQLYDMSRDEKIIRHDFNIIRNKVREGKAHELSESDTSYLGACTKASKGTDRRSQPYSDIPAKPRAFSLKNSYMTGILRSMYSTTQTTISNKYKTVEEYIFRQLKPYIGKSQLEIYEKIKGIKYEKENIPKNISKRITDELIGRDEDLVKKDDLFTKTKFIIKNLPITPKNKARERMSFRTLELSEFEEDWESSYWKNYFEETTILTILWKQPTYKSKNGERILEGVKKINFNDNDFKSFEKTYNYVKKTIEKRDVNLLPTPNTFDNQYLVVAPKGQKGDDAYNNFFKNNKTKVAFMLTKELLNNKIS